MTDYIQVLADELTHDPLGRGYAGMSDEQAAVNLNTVDRTRQRDTVLGHEIFNATDHTEYAALADAQKDRWLALCAIDIINIASGVAKALEAEIFGPGTTTRDNLLALKTENISRATELGLGTVKVGHVQMARSVS
jgi:hypothetical protein